MYFRLTSQPVADIMRVYRALQELFVEDPDDDVKRWCRDALAECLRVAGSVSFDAYTAWHGGLDDRSLWPTPAKVRATFGDWRKARAQLEAIPQQDVMSRKLRGTYNLKSTREGTIEALRVWGDSLGDELAAEALSWDSWLGWAREAADDPELWHLELWFSPNAFLRHFDSFTHAKAEAGLIRRAGEKLSRLSCRCDHLDDEQMLDLLRDSARELGCLPTYGAQQRHAQRLNEQAGRLVMPSAKDFTRRFGSWGKALVRAGLCTAQQAAARNVRGEVPLTREFALDCLRLATEWNGGRRVIRNRYRRWRAEDAPRHAWLRRPPSDNWIHGEFGSFDAAAAQAQSTRSFAEAVARLSGCVEVCT
jgi:hypothetical protein